MKALEVCYSCPVIEECLAYACKNETGSIWGGHDPDERNSIRKQRISISEAVAMFRKRFAIEKKIGRRGAREFVASH